MQGDIEQVVALLESSGRKVLCHGDAVACAIILDGIRMDVAAEEASVIETFDCSVDEASG